MRRFTALAAMTALLILTLGNNVVLAQAPPTPAVRHLFRTEGLPLSGPFDVVQQLLHYAPGGATRWHTHPGLVLLTVIEGTITFRVEGTETVYQTGETITELPGQVVQTSNATGAPATAMVTGLVPKGAPFSTPVPGDTTPPPLASPAFPFRTEGLAVPGSYEVAQQVLDFAPGAATPWHTHPGLVVVTVIDGTLTFQVERTEKVYQTGESFTEMPGHVAQARNATGARTSVIATFLLPKGAPLSTPVPAPALPLPPTGEEGAPVLFPETGYTLDGAFLRYWQAHGGLAVFGYPIDSARQVNGQVSQWLERARFELHPEQSAPYNVLLARLGVEVLARQGRDWTTFATASPDTAYYFAETGHAVAPEFWNYWRTHGLEFGDAGVSFRESLALFGYPISTAQMEMNTSGDRVLTQWFERARFEYHAENPAADRVLLGRLGAEVQAVQQR